MKSIKIIALFVTIVFPLSLMARDKKKKDGAFQPAAREISTGLVEGSANLTTGIGNLSDSVENGADKLGDSLIQATLTLERIANNKIQEIKEASENAGLNAGLGPLKYIGYNLTRGRQYVAERVEAFATTGAATATAGTAKTIAFAQASRAAIIAWPATPYIVGVATAAGTVYVGHKVYRRIVPTAQEKKIYGLRKRAMLSAMESVAVEAEAELEKQKANLSEAQARKLGADLSVFKARCALQREMFDQKDNRLAAVVVS